ncbi:MAG TPA: sigma-70 family RNA polymerase sigma factor [Puia sp.]|nr:sigma-70 family RNA polymerase sigma factor [Puia sp.]
MHNEQEFIGIIKENEGLIYKVTRLYANNKEDEQDLYQDIVYQLWRSFGSFRKEAKISTWMYRIALNTSIAWLTRAKKKREHLPIGEWLTNETDASDLVKDERIEALYAIIKQLNTIEKAIILLYLEGKTYEEIENITGFTATNIGTRLTRIKQKIRSQIKK